MQAREKDLEVSRKDTERKLAEANFETQQVCSFSRNITPRANKNKILGKRVDYNSLRR